MNDEEKFQVWVADLADYNAGRLSGFWMDVTDDTDEMQEQITVFLKERSAATRELHEEWAFHDYNYPWGNLGLGEYESLENLAAIASAYDQCGNDEEREAFTVWANDNRSYDYGSFSSSLVTICESFDEYAEELFWDCYGHDIPDNLKVYFDIEAFARDLAIDYHIEDLPCGSVVVFEL